MNRIKEIRKSQGKTQDDLADHLSISHQSVSLYELGKRDPTTKVWIMLADYLDVSLDYLMGRKSSNL